MGRKSQNRGSGENREQEEVPTMIKIWWVNQKSGSQFYYLYCNLFIKDQSFKNFFKVGVHILECQVITPGSTS